MIASRSSSAAPRVTLEVFNDNPGTYFKTTGWMERGETLSGELNQLSVQRKLGMDQSYEELAAKYGEENAKYIWDTLWRHGPQLQPVHVHRDGP